MMCGYIGAKDESFHGVKFDAACQKHTIRLCRAGKLDTMVVSVKSGKNGCNLQGMTRMVSLGWIPAYTEELQAKGQNSIQGVGLS
jgi:hypothetical protein